MLSIQNEVLDQEPVSDWLFAHYGSLLQWAMDGAIQDKKINIGIGRDLSLAEVVEALPRLALAKEISLHVESYHLSMLHSVLAALPNIHHIGFLGHPYHDLLSDIEFPYLDLLESVSLNEVTLTALPSWLGRIPHLKRFTCVRVQLEDERFQMLNLESLESLYISEMDASIALAMMVHCPKLRRLHLSSQTLHTLPDTIQICNQLEFIYLSGSSITTLPESMVHLTQLQQIYLPDNAHLDLRQIFKVLATCPRLSKVVCDAPAANWFAMFPEKTFLPFANHATELKINSLDDLNQIMYFPNITKLTIFATHLKNISHQLGYLKHLKFLKIYRSDLLEALPDVFGTLNQLEIIELDYLKALKKLPPSFYKSKSIKIIRFYNSQRVLNIAKLRHIKTLTELSVD